MSLSSSAIPMLLAVVLWRTPPALAGPAPGVQAEGPALADGQESHDQQDGQEPSSAAQEGSQEQQDSGQEPAGARGASQQPSTATQEPGVQSRSPETPGDDWLAPIIQQPQPGPSPPPLSGVQLPRLTALPGILPPDDGDCPTDPEPEQPHCDQQGSR